MKPNNIIYLAIFACILIIIFRPWFLTSEIIGGDWPYYFNETLKDFTFFPLSWSAEYNNGLGGIDSLYFLHIFQGFTILLTYIFHISWVISYKLFWFGFFIVLSIISSMVFLKNTLPNVRFWQLIVGCIIFVSNTYILMVVGGGQMGVALAYSVAPLVLARFIKIIQNSNLKIQNSLIAGLVLAIQVLFDPRIAYITMMAVGIYYVFCITYYASQKNILNTLYSIFYTFVIPIGIVALLHASWILPIFLFRQNPLVDAGQAFTNAGMVQFLSFAHFSDAIALLHPNWPENLFGKVYFMRSEFLFLPVLTYSSLLLLKKSNRTIIFFTLIALLGSFLAKGANPPFVEVYLWLFDNIPGFVLFRDPTKFYLLAILAYSVLIPFSLEQIADLLVKKKIMILYGIFPITFLLYWLFLIHPAFLGQLGGTFQKHEVPKEYVLLKDFLHNQPEFFRVLWVPKRVRFGYYTNNHSAIESEQLFGTQDIIDIVKKFNAQKTKEYIAALGVRYIVVPFDPLGEIFVKDRKYDNAVYEETMKQLAQVSWLTKVDGFGKIVLFKTQTAHDRFWLSGGGKISYVKISPVVYKVMVQIAQPQQLNFSESYNPSWVAKTESFMSISRKTDFGLNSFVLPNKGTYALTVIFTQQKYYEYGQMISIITLTSIVFILLVMQAKKYIKYNL